MEPTVIVSAFAVGVSVLSVAANVFIARRSARAGLEVLRFKAELDRADALSKSIKEIEIEGERLRIRGWELMMRADSLMESTRDEVSPHSIMFEATQKFLEQARVFLEVWATAKSDVPDTVIQHLRSIRHDCRHHIEDILALLDRIPDKPVNSRLHLEQISRTLMESIRRLLEEIDGFITISGMVRRALVRGDKPDEFLTLPALPGSRAQS